MRSIPLAVLLSFPTPDYIHPETRGLTAVILILVLSCFVVAVVALRVYTRVYIQRWPGLDDLFMVFAVVCLQGKLHNMGEAKSLIDIDGWL